MDEMTKNEDFFPEMTEKEKKAVIIEYLKNVKFRRVYEQAPEMAKRRLEVAFWISKYKGKRNMWSIRELRVKLEAKMDLASIKYLAANFPSDVGREHYRELLATFKLRRSVTLRRYQRLIDSLKRKCDRDFYLETYSAIDDLGDDAVMLDKALLWRATCGGVEACALLGDAFLHGHEVYRVPHLAAFWLEKAAQEGDKMSIEHMEELKKSGLA